MKLTLSWFYTLNITYKYTFHKRKYMCIYTCIFFFFFWLFFIVCLWLSLRCGTCTSLVVAHGFCSWCLGLSCPMACGILLPWSEIDPGSPALEAWILNQDQQGSFLCISLFMFMYIMRYQTVRNMQKEIIEKSIAKTLFSHTQNKYVSILPYLVRVFFILYKRVK